MSIFKLNADKSVDPLSTILHKNFPTVQTDINTPFGILNANNNKILQYNNIVKSEQIDNYSKNIRSTLTGQAIRNDKYNYYNGSFDIGYPANDIYSFCNHETATIYQYNLFQFTRKVKNDSGYPLDVTIQKVKDSVQENQYGKNYTGNCVGCPGNIPPDPVTGLCTSDKKCIPEPLKPCPEPELINLKSIIYGYAFYLDTIRTVNVPNIGKRLVRCAGGHKCNRTHFRPKLKLSDNSIVLPSNNISLDNIDGIYPGYPSVPQYYPVQGFEPQNNRERSDSFTFTVSDPSLLDNTCEVYLECLSPNNVCHTGVTMIFLVGQRSDNDEYVLIFADCLAPGSINGEFLGSVPCNDDPPVDCDPPTPPPTPTPPPLPPGYVCVVPKSQSTYERVCLGLFGWDVEAGRVASFGNTMSYGDLQDFEYKKLMNNTVRWLTKETNSPKILLLPDTGIGSWTTPVPNYTTTLKSALEYGGAQVTVASQQWFQFDGSELNSSYDLIIPGGAYNWWNGSDMPLSGQQAIVNFVKSGKAMLTQEWIYWRSAVTASSFAALKDILPGKEVAPWTTLSALRWTNITPNSIIDNGVPPVYAWIPGDADGSITFIQSVKPGATIFYDFVATVGSPSVVGDPICISTETYNSDISSYTLISGPYSASDCENKCGGETITETPTPTPTPTPTCFENPDCCLNELCASGVGIYNRVYDISILNQFCGDPPYCCNNGLTINITSQTEAGFSNSENGQPMYDIVIEVS
jgi:hypothetical protein